MLCQVQFAFGAEGEFACKIMELTISSQLNGIIASGRTLDPHKRVACYFHNFEVLYLFKSSTNDVWHTVNLTAERTNFMLFQYDQIVKTSISNQNLVAD